MQARRLGLDDVQIACELVRVHKEKTVSPEYMRRFLANPRNHLIAAFSDGKVVGFALGYETDRVDRDQTQMCLYEVGVHPDCRRKGAGRAVISEIKRICKEHNAVNMWVITDESNEPAKGLYASTGGSRSDPADPSVVFTYTDYAP